MMLAVALWPAPMFGQDPSSLSPEEREVLGRLFTEARSAYDVRDYGTSIARLEEAYALLPEPNILYRIAEMHEELGQRDQAIASYEAYLTARPGAPNTAVVRTRVERLRAEKEAAAPKTARLTIDSVPQGARVYVDANERKGVTPLELDVKPGAYTIRLELDGHEPAERPISVEAGELRSFDFNLSSTAPPVVPTAPHEPSLAPWVIAGAGGSLAIASSVLLLIAVDRQDTIDAYDASRDRTQRPADYDSVLDQEMTYRVAGWTAAGLAVGCLATAGVLWWLDDADEVALGVTPAAVNLVVRF